MYDLVLLSKKKKILLRFLSCWCIVLTFSDFKSRHAFPVCMQVSEVSIRLYSLVHWEDPMEMGLGTPTSPSGSQRSSSTKEGALLYRTGTSYLGKELWKSCYLVLRYSSKGRFNLKYTLSQWLDLMSVLTHALC